MDTGVGNSHLTRVKTLTGYWRCFVTGKMALHANYAASELAGLRAAYRSLCRIYQAVMEDRRRKSTDDLSDY